MPPLSRLTEAGQGGDHSFRKTICMDTGATGSDKPAALSLLASERPRNVTWKQAAGLLFGDWGTSRLYVLGLAFFYAQRTSIYLICAMSVLILAVAWAYSNICRIYPDGAAFTPRPNRRAASLRSLAPCCCLPITP
jgi:hypothetical protein